MIFDKVTDKNKSAPFYGPRCTFPCNTCSLDAPASAF